MIEKIKNNSLFIILILVVKKLCLTFSEDIIINIINSNLRLYNKSMNNNLLIYYLNDDYKSYIDNYIIENFKYIDNIIFKDKLMNINVSLFENLINNYYYCDNNYDLKYFNNNEYLVYNNYNINIDAIKSYLLLEINNKHLFYYVLYIFLINSVTDEEFKSDIDSYIFINNNIDYNKNIIKLFKFNLNNKMNNKLSSIYSINTLINKLN